MGRPKLPEARENYTVRVKPSTVAEIDRLALKAGMERARLMRNIIEMQVEFLSKSDKVGIYTLSVLMRDMEEQLRSWVRMLKDDPMQVMEMRT